MRTTDDTQVTITLESVKLQDQAVSVALALDLTLPLPPQDPSLPDAIEAHVHRAGLEVQRALFRALIEFADRQLVLSRRDGKDGAGVELRGTRPFTFKTVFGTVTVRRTRITDRADGSSRTPAATAWGTAHRCALTRGLRETICDQFADESASEARGDVGERAGEPNLVSKATVIDGVHREGTALIEAIRRRADQGLQGDAATDAVVVQLDEVKTEAQPHTGRKEIWAFTAVMTIAGWSHLLVDASQEGLDRQVAAPLHKAGVLAGARPLLVVADGAGWIRSWYEALAAPLESMVLCWYHLRTRCSQKISGSGLPKAAKKPLLGRVLTSLWGGEVDEAVRASREARREATRPDWIDELIAYLEARRPYLADYKARKEAGQVNASTRVEKFNDWAVSDRCKGRGMSWTAEGVLSLAVLEAARRNGELEAWRRDRRLPKLEVPRSSPKAA